MKKKQSFKVSEFSKISGFSLKALRIYESAGILVPHRSENKYRFYSHEQIELSREIHFLKNLGFSLKEIKSLLPFHQHQDCCTLSSLESQLEKNKNAIATLKEQQLQLKDLISSIKNKSKFSKQAGLTGKTFLRNALSQSILSLSEKELLEKTKVISNQEYLTTVAMVDDHARAKMLSVLSEKAIQLVSADLKKLDKQYRQFWGS